MVEVDGSIGEGGGQIVRMALVLGLVTATPFRLHSIRSRRPRAGLKNQLLHLISGLRMISGAQISGDSKYSTELLFVPGPIEGGCVEIRSHEAISIPLLLQGLVPVALRARAPSKLALQGGTDIANSMSFDYYIQVVAPRLGRINVVLDRRGFYPAGGGNVRLLIEPHAQKPLTAIGGRIGGIHATSVASSELSKDGVAEKLIHGATQALALARLSATSSIQYCDADSVGAVITLVAELENGQRLGADALINNLERPEETGALAARTLIDELRSGAAVDRDAAPDLILHLALEGGTIDVAGITPHMQAAMYVCEQFLGPIFMVQGRTITVTR